MLNRLICLILGYFIGAIIQTGFWIGKFNHIDIRDYGSGNAEQLILCVHLERKPDL